MNMSDTAANKRKATIHGIEVEQVYLQKNWYTTVDSKVKIAEHADPAQIRTPGAGYHVQSVQFVQIGDRWAYHCMVEYPVGSGVVKPGTDFIDTKDASGVAKAETSAIGRALGLHGIASEDGIASAEEMGRVEAKQQTQQQQTQQQQQPWNFLMDHAFRGRARALGYVSVSQVEELVTAACGAGQPVTKAKVRIYLEALETKAKVAKQSGEQSSDLRQAFTGQART
jgi:hypothetical protein